MSDCEVCNVTMRAPTDTEEPSEICSNCALTMLEHATNLGIAPFLNVSIDDMGIAYVVVEEDIGPSIEVMGRYGPFSMGEAFRRAVRYDATGDLSVLSNSGGVGEKR